MTIVETKYGPMSVIDGDTISERFKIEEHYELGMSEHLVGLCEKRRAALDVGAHIGSHTVVYQRHFRRVFAFEPHRTLFEALKMNAAKNTVAINEALLHRPGIEKFAERKRNYGASGISTSGYQCKVNTIDSFALSDVDLIKIDVEGAELNVLAGAQETIRRCLPVIMFESWGQSSFFKLMPRMYAEISDFQLLPFLLDCGYRKFTKHGKNIVCR